MQTVFPGKIQIPVSVSIFWVTHHRMPDGRQVRPDLMRTSRNQRNLKQRQILLFLSIRPVSHRSIMRLNHLRIFLLSECPIHLW